MTTVAHLSALYSAAPIVLWVEDPLTRDYLSAVWGGPPEISFLISNGLNSVRAAVDAAINEGINHVFGLIDRDFGITNFAKWKQPGTRRFYTPALEIENYLLEADAMAGCSLNNRGRSSADIEAELVRFAAQQPSWLACRRTLSKMRSELQQDFPAHPKLAAITSPSHAQAHIESSPWFTALPTRAASWTSAGKIAMEIGGAKTAYDADLVTGAWKSEFSGKEIFRPIRSFVYQPPLNPGEPDNDFAKAVGDWQFANSRVPSGLTALLDGLRFQVGLAP